MIYLSVVHLKALVDFGGRDRLIAKDAKSNEKEGGEAELQDFHGKIIATGHEKVTQGNLKLELDTVISDVEPRI